MRGCVTGYDACSHLGEETQRADVSAPIGVIIALAVSSVIGWLYILALLFSIQVRAVHSVWDASSLY